MYNVQYCAQVINFQLWLHFAVWPNAFDLNVTSWVLLVKDFAFPVIHKSLSPSMLQIPGQEVHFYVGKSLV